MNSLRGKTLPSRNARPGLLKRGIKKLKLGLMACAAAGIFACTAPLVDNWPPRQGPLPKPTYSVHGTRSTLLYFNKKTRTVYPVTDAAHPVIHSKAPAELTVNFYPVVLKDRFDSFVKNKLRFPIIPCNVKTFTGWPRSKAVWSSYTGKTRKSYVIVYRDVPSKFVVGTPIRITVNLRAPSGKDRQTFGVTGPKGFLEVVSVKPFERVPSSVGFRRRRSYWAPTSGVKPVPPPASTGYRKRRRYYAPSAR